MSDRGYPMVVRALSEEDGGGFVATAPDLQGCMGDGETPEAALLDLRSAIEEWIDEYKRLGREVPAPGTLGKIAEQEREELEGLLKAQDEMIQTQDHLLDEAREEVNRIRDVVGSLLESSIGRDRIYLSWGDVNVRSVIAASVLARKAMRITN